MVEGRDPTLCAYLAELGACFASDDFAAHPEFRPERAMSRADAIHDFQSIGTALSGLDPIPSARLAAATHPVLVINGRNDNPDDAVARLDELIPHSTAVVAGHRTHPPACSDPVIHTAVVTFLQHNWSN